MTDIECRMDLKGQRLISLPILSIRSSTNLFISLQSPLQMFKIHFLIHILINTNKNKLLINQIQTF